MNKKEIGDFIREKRIEKKLSQKQLGTLSGVRYQCLSHVEKGNQSYGIETLIAILGALGYIVVIWNDEISAPLPSPVSALDMGKATDLVPYEEVPKTKEKVVSINVPGKRGFNFKKVRTAQAGDKNEKHF